MRPKLFYWLLLLSLPAVSPAAPRTARGYSGQALPPIFRQVGLVPMGAPKLAEALWTDFDGKVSLVVYPVEEIDSRKVAPEMSRLHYLIDGGRWELSQSEALLKRLQEKSPAKGRSSGWILNGDVGSMVTNLREFAAFCKKLDAIRPEAPLYLSCRSGTAPETCLPRSLYPFVRGVVWDVSFQDKEEAACLVAATGACRDRAEKFFESLNPTAPGASMAPAWSIRVPLMALAQLGEPLKILKALYARFLNDGSSSLLLLGVDAATAKKVLSDSAPYQGVRDWLIELTQLHLERNVDLASNLENPYPMEGGSLLPETSKLEADGIEGSFRKPFALTRLTVTFAPSQRPKQLRVYFGDGEGEYYIRSFVLPPLSKNDRPETIFTQPLFFAGVHKIVVKAEGGKLNAVSAMGWPMKR